jgi:uncharacterized membrane protein
MIAFLVAFIGYQLYRIVLDVTLGLTVAEVALRVGAARASA